MEKDHQELSVWRQREILKSNRSSLYYKWTGLNEEDRNILSDLPSEKAQHSGSRALDLSLSSSGCRDRPNIAWAADIAYIRLKPGSAWTEKAA